MVNFFGHSLVAAEAATLFNDAAMCRAMLDFETALATAQAQEGVIPAWAAQAIAAACRELVLEPQALVDAARHSGAMAVPLVAMIAQALETHCPDAVNYLHFGTTTQDVVDTAQVMMSRDACGLLLAQLDGCIGVLLALAERHRCTPMLARTLLQPAQVTTLGLRCILWAQPLQRSRDQLRALGREALVLQLGGAVGNLSTLGTAGLRVSERVAAQLQLGHAQGSWHTQRDAWVRLGMEVAVLAGSLSKIAKDLALLSQTEVGELLEGGNALRGSSSAMPHKRNPVACMQALAATVQVPHLAAALLSTMAQAHERALGEWQAEVAVWPQLWIQGTGACMAVARALDGLEVDTARMIRNIEQLNGMVYSEALVQALVSVLGKPQAAALVQAAARRAHADGMAVLDALLDSGALTSLGPTPRSALQAACDLQAAAEPSARLCSRLLQATHQAVAAACAH